MNAQMPPILDVIYAINKLPAVVVLEHASELCHILSNLIDGHAKLIANFGVLLNKLEEHYHETDVQELLIAMHDLTPTEQIQIFADQLVEQKKQHHALKELMASISIHLTTSVEHQEIHETVNAIMEKYKELMEKK